MSRLAPLTAAFALFALPDPAMALEKPRYRVLQEIEGIEVREYAPYLVAETEVTGSREEAGNAGFRRLADFIFGKNRGERRIAMTAPVAQQEERPGAAASAAAPPAGARIAMTAPVAQQEVVRAGAEASPPAAAPSPAPGAGERSSGGGPSWVIQFMMPSELTLATLPEPLDPAVRFREIPARRVAALRYSGGWFEERYLEKLAELRAAMDRAGLRATGEPVWARYDPPFMPWFLRTNEILVELAP
jgi:hypothetical protein